MERLPNPPDGVTNEIHADVRIVLVRGANESGVRLADQVAQRHTAILVLLGDGKGEAKVGPNQLGPRLLARLVIGRSPHRSGELLLLLRREHRLPTQLLDIKIQQVAIVTCRVHRSPPALAAPAIMSSPSFGIHTGHNTSIRRCVSRVVRANLPPCDGVPRLTPRRSRPPFCAAAPTYTPPERLGAYDNTRTARHAETRPALRSPALSGGAISSP